MVPCSYISGRYSLCKSFVNCLHWKYDQIALNLCLFHGLAGAVQVVIEYSANSKLRKLNERQFESLADIPKFFSKCPGFSRIDHLNIAWVATAQVPFQIQGTAGCSIPLPCTCFSHSSTSSREYNTKSLALWMDAWEALCYLLHPLSVGFLTEDAGKC